MLDQFHPLFMFWLGGFFVVFSLGIGGVPKDNKAPIYAIFALLFSIFWFLSIWFMPPRNRANSNFPKS